MSVNGFTFGDDPTIQKYNYESLDNIPDIENGTYPNMAVGSLLGTNTVTDSEPYFIRPSASIGDREYDEIVGGTLGWNQLAQNYSQSKTENGITWTNNGDGTYTANGTATADSYVDASALYTGKANHVMFISGCPSGGGRSTYMIFDAFFSYLNSADYGAGRIFKKNENSDSAACRCYVWSGATVSNLIFKPQFIDLTALFGSTIADYIYSLEQATAGAGVAWVRKYLPNDYYAYCAPKLEHVTGVSAHVMTGFNQWDEVAEIGFINTSTGENLSANDALRSKNYIPCLNAEYYVTSTYTSASNKIRLYFYDGNKSFISVVPLEEAHSGNDYGHGLFTPPASAKYVRFSVGNLSNPTYNHDICINLHWDGEKDGQYEPYVKHSYPLDDSLTLRGIPKLDASNNLYYDGDVYASDGTVTRRYGIVDLGTLNYTYNGVFSAVVDDMKANPYTSENLKCAKYPTMPMSYGSFTYGIRYAGGNHSIGIKDPAYTDAATFKTAMSGVYLVYEKATPTTSAASPFTSPQIVDDFGTEEYVTTGLVPVGHNTQYPENLAEKIASLPSLPTEAGTYRLKVTVTAGKASYEWVSA